MTILQDKNTISTTLGELKEISRIAFVEYLNHPDETIINITLDEKGNGEITSPPNQDVPLDTYHPTN